MERLDSAALLPFLHTCLTGLDHPIAVPAEGVLLTEVLSSQEFLDGWKPQVGERHLRVVRVNAYPSGATVPTLLDPLTNLPAAYRWSTRVLVVPPEEADARVKQLQWMWYARRQDARSRLRRAITQQPAAAPDPDEQAIFEDRAARGMAMDSAALAVQALTRRGFGAAVETVNTTDAWLGSLPGHGAADLRRDALPA